LDLVLVSLKLIRIFKGERRVFVLLGSLKILESFMYVDKHLDSHEKKKL
jgi:hypothetical protein